MARVVGNEAQSLCAIVFSSSPLLEPEAVLFGRPVPVFSDPALFFCGQPALFAPESAVTAIGQLH
jgi:hypothetical protein